MVYWICYFYFYGTISRIFIRNLIFFSTIYYSVELDMKRSCSRNNPFKNCIYELCFFVEQCVVYFQLSSFVISNEINDSRTSMRKRQVFKILIAICLYLLHFSRKCVDIHLFISI